MLVATVIVALLAALLLPSLFEARNWALESRCVGNLRNLHAGLLAYASDHEGTLPPSQWGDWSAWWHPLYLNGSVGAKAFACPLDSTTYAPGNSSPFVYNGRSYPNGKVSYGGLGSDPQAQGAPAIPSADYTKAWGKPLARFPKPAASVLLAEQQTIGCQLAKIWCFQYPQFPSEMAFPHRHGTAANILFMDGHIVSMTKDQYQRASAAHQIVVSF